jgi:hypothetical protein
VNTPALYLQLSLLEKQDFWVNEYPGTYFVRLNDLLYSNYEVEYLSGLTVEDIAAVSNVVFDGVLLNEVSSAAACIALIGSFFASSSVLYVHSPLNNDPYNHDVQIGIAFEYRKGGEQYENGQEIEELLLSVPNITKSLSDVFNSKVIFSGGNVDLNNSGGYFDTFLEDEEIIGNRSKLFVRHPVTNVKEQVLSGAVQGGDLEITKLSLSIKDDKESLNIPIPPNRYNLTDYPQLNTDNVDKPIPIGFGNIYHAPMICSNELGAEPFYFICADRTIAEIHDIDYVYVDGVSKAFTKDLTNNRFSLSAANYTPGQVVTCDYQGYEDSTGAVMRNACDILKFLFIEFFNFADTSDFFDIWDRVHAFNIYLFVNEIKKFWEIVEQICKDSFLNLILNGDSTYSAIVNDRDGYYLREIRNYEIINVGNIGYDSSKILSSVLVKYRKDHDSGEWLQRLVNDTEEEIHDIYNQYYFKEIEVNLDNETDAYNYGLWLLNYFNSAYKTFKIRMDYFEARDLILGKNYKINFARPVAPNLGDCVVKIVATSENLNTFKNELTLQIIEKIPETIEQTVSLWNDFIYGEKLYTCGCYEEV